MVLVWLFWFVYCFFCVFCIVFCFLFIFLFFVLFFFVFFCFIFLFFVCFFLFFFVFLLFFFVFFLFFFCCLFKLHCILHCLIWTGLTLDTFEPCSGRRYIYFLAASSLSVFSAALHVPRIATRAFCQLPLRATSPFRISAHSLKLFSIRSWQMPWLILIG